MQDPKNIMIELLKRNRKLFFWESIAFIILGVAALTAPVLFSITIDLMIGWLAILAACLLAARIAQSQAVPNTASAVMSMILYLILGLLLLAYPLSGIITLNILLACFFICDGVFKLTSAIQLKPAPRWGWIFLNGILSFILGLLIIVSLPGGAPWVLGILIGINLLASGLVQLGMILALPKDS
jgi:uncharacterized membrane protein HdeD (DUF308 family)